MQYSFLMNMAFADAIMGFDSNHLILYSVMPMNCKILGVGQKKDKLETCQWVRWIGIAFFWEVLDRYPQ